MALSAVWCVSAAAAQTVAERSLGEGPYDQLVIRGTTLIDGAGAPPAGPVDIVVKGGRSAEIVSVDTPGLPIEVDGRPAALQNHITLTSLLEIHVTRLGSKFKGGREKFLQYNTPGIHVAPGAAILGSVSPAF